MSQFSKSLCKLNLAAVLRSLPIATTYRHQRERALRMRYLSHSCPIRNNKCGFVGIPTLMGFEMGFGIDFGDKL